MSRFTHLLANQAIPVNTQSLSNAISDSHKTMRKNKIQYGTVFNGETLEYGKGNNFTIKLVTEYRKTTFFGIKIPKRTEVQLLDRRGKIIDSFTFNRGKDLHKKVEAALAKLRNNASTELNPTNGATGNENRIDDETNQPGTKKELNSNIYQKVAGIGTKSREEVRAELDAAKHKREAEEQKTNSSTPESNETTPQLTPITSPNALQAAVAKVLPHQKIPPADAAPQTEVPAGLTAPDVTGTEEMIQTNGVDIANEVPHMNPSMDMPEVQQKLEACSSEINRISAYNKDLQLSQKNDFGIKHPEIPMDLLSRTQGLTTEIGINKHTILNLRKGEQVTGPNSGSGLMGSEGDRVFLEGGAKTANRIKDYFFDPNLSLSIEERKQGLETIINTYKHFANQITTDRDIKGVDKNKEMALTPEKQKQELQSLINILEQAKNEIDTKNTIANSAGVALSSVFQITENEQQLRELGEDVRKLRDEFKHDKTRKEESQTVTINGQIFTIQASKAKKQKFFGKAGTQITLTDFAGNSASFIFNRGRDLDAKLQGALKSIATQTYITQSSKSLVEQSCLNARQNLSKWSSSDGTSGIFQKMQTTQMDGASSGDWVSQISEQRKTIGQLQHPVGVLRRALELLEAGKTVDSEINRVLDLSEKMISRTQSDIQKAKTQGIINEEQSEALLNDLKSAVNTIAEALPDNKALQNFAKNFANLTLTDEK